MKILALTSEFPPFVGGIGAYAHQIARAATELGHEVTLLAPDYGGEFSAGDRTDYPFPVQRYRGGPHRATDLVAKVLLVRSLVREERFDLIHAMDWPFFVPAALAAPGMRRVHTVHGSEIFRMGRPTRRLAIKAAGVFRGDFSVVAISAFTRDLFRAHFGEVPQDASAAVHLGVGRDWLGFAGRKAEERQQLGLPEAAMVVLTLARVTRRKGHLTALSALNQLTEPLRENLVYVIAGPDGEDDYGRELEAAMAASSVAVMRLRGLDQRAVMGLCAASDIFCLPGGHGQNGEIEGFGLVLLEAGAQGLPLIAGDVGGVAEVVEDGVSGLVVPASDAAGLARALARLAEDADLRARLGRGARARAEAMSWQRCAAQTYRLA